MRLEGKVAVVSGGGTGIGAAVAHRFAAEGAHVVITGRRPEPLSEVAADTGGLAVPGDVSDPDHASQVVSGAIRAFGGIDVVVANAGIGFGGSVAEVSDEDWARTLDVNLTGAMRLVRACIPALIDRGGGSIVLMSSVAGVAGPPSSAAYSASKAGLISLARSIAVDHAADGIRANAVCPGWVRTPLADGDMDELADARGLDREGAYALATELVPMQRPGDPEEIAACVLFLASDDASYVTGATLPADGGLLVTDVGSVAFRGVW